ncbi:hypothetical protein IWW50_002555 [Coemansia erecta]|nr:hypothetical protein IWW50_002555 [Coemansia erecta]
MEAFVHFYIDQLANTKSDQMAIVYAYGLMQTAMVTWTEALPGEQVKRITSAVVDALADCDKSLSRYTCWNPYHQLFISSLRCLTSWISILPDSTHLTPETLSKLVSLLARCNTFINCAGPKSQNAHTKHGLRLQLITSNVEESTVDYSLDPLDDTDEDEDASPGTESSGGSIKAFTMLGLFGKSAKIALPAFVCNGECKKIHMLSRSLYRTLYTAIAVFSSTILRGMDTMQAYARYAPTDVFTARRAISQKRLPDTSFILKGFSKQIVRKLDGYVPTSIRIFSVFHRAVYTAINFQRYENGKWSDSVIFTTSRYAGGSKQWLAFPSMPSTEDCPSTLPTDPQCKHDDEYDSLPWIRLGNEVMYPKSVKKKLRFSDAHGTIRGIKSQVDDASEREIELITASDFKRLHGHREMPDMRFAPAQLPEQQPRGNTYDRPTCTSFFGIDFALVEIVEPVLRELDQLDDLDRPFSAHTGIIYLQSPESLSTKRDICKGPLRGTSREFSHFLSMLNRQQLSPAELVKRHSDVPLLRYVFGIKGFKVCYNLAPNLSAMISGKQMCADDNREFYELLHERGIAVLWFDSHPGTLDTDLAWQFIDRLQSYDVMPQRRFRDDEYLQTGAQPRTSLGIPAASVPVRGGSEIRSRSVGKRSARSQSPPRKKTRPSNRAIYRGRSRRTPGPNSQSIWNSSKPGDIVNVTRRAQAGKNKDPCAYIKSAATEVSISASVNPPEVAPQGTRTPQNAGTPQSTTTTRQGAKSNRERGTDKQTIVGPSNMSTESLMTFLASNPQDPYNYRGQSTGDANRPTETAYAKKLEPKVRILIGLAPVVNTRGRLIKIAVSAKGGPEKLNRDFELMTGPLMSNMVVEAKDIAYILSATILDASANIASLSGSDFSMVYKRMEMIHRIIEKHSIKHESISDAHKFMFPVGTSGVQSTLHINGSGVDPSTD